MKLKEIINFRRIKEFDDEIRCLKKDICNECPFHNDNLCVCISYNKTKEFPCIMDKLIDMSKGKTFENTDMYDYEEMKNDDYNEESNNRNS